MAKIELPVLLKKTKATVSKANLAALQQRGIHPDKFAAAVEEAVRTNSEIIACENLDTESFGRAIREACLDGLPPDGRKAMIRVGRNGTARYYPTKQGLLSLLKREIEGIDIQSGFVREGDDHSFVEETGKDPVFRVSKNLNVAEDAPVIGSWAYAKVPGQTGKLYVMTRHDIAKARSRSSMKSSDGPWSVWTGSMAEGSALKGLANRLRYLLPENSFLESVIERDFRREEEYRAEDDVADVTLGDPSEDEALVVEGQTEPPGGTPEEAGGKKESSEAPKGSESDGETPFDTDL